MFLYIIVLGSTYILIMDSIAFQFFCFCATAVFAVDTYLLFRTFQSSRAERANNSNQTATGADADNQDTNTKETWFVFCI